MIDLNDSVERVLALFFLLATLLCRRASAAASGSNFFALTCPVTAVSFVFNEANVFLSDIAACITSTYSSALRSCSGFMKESHRRFISISSSFSLRLGGGGGEGEEEELDAARLTAASHINLNSTGQAAGDLAYHGQYGDDA